MRTMALISVTADLTCLILTLLMVYGTLFEMKHKSPQKNAFLLCVSVNGLTILCDFVSWLVEGRADFIHLNYIVTTETFVAPYLILLAFVRYVILFLEGKWGVRNRLNDWSFRAVSVYSAVCFVLVLIGCCTGGLFSLAGCVYTDGPYYNYYLATMAVFFLYTILLILRYARLMGPHDSLAMATYIFCPIVGVIINAFYPDISINFSLAALSCAAIYIMLQSETEMRLDRMVRLDELTGCMSRHAYTDFLDRVPANARIGAIFSDVNGLKYTNDHEGHEAGDRLLRSMANLLHLQFGREEVFRISGDEFVVLTEGMDRETFDSRCQELQKRLEEFPFPIACMGSAYGTGGEAAELVERAEEEMRQAKLRFYKAYPKYKRN